MTVEPNTPALWQSNLPVPGFENHKYYRGYVAIYGAPELTGATRLAASACNRIGAGLVSVVATSNADIYRTALPADIMVTSKRPPKATVALGGSGGIEQDHFQDMLSADQLAARVFDADALPLDFGKIALDETCILTPHHAEFERVFGEIGEDPARAAQKAAQISGACIVLKAPLTVIASPGGHLVINDHASPYLAKAGTGDVLAGLIAGLAAQGMAPFLAACSAVWMHGEAAIRFGPGLIASDIPELMPEILKELLASPSVS